MEDYKKEYYEQSEFWEKDFLKFPNEKERIEKIIDAIPSDVKDILDAGCGNGAFLNAVNANFPNRFNNAMGLDISKKALEYVKNGKILGSIANLPFKDNSFDLLNALEVLEHLSQKDFQKATLELQRVSRKYIIISVPNDQNLELYLVRCPECCCRFNPDFHLKTFNRDKLDNLFKSFKLIELTEAGNPLIKNFPLYTKLQIIYYHLVWKKLPPPQTAICPQCGYSMHKKNNSLLKNKNHTFFLSNCLLLFKQLVKSVILSKKKKEWLVAIYEKQQCFKI